MDMKIAMIADQWLKDHNYVNTGNCCGNCIYAVTMSDGCMKCNHPSITKTVPDPNDGTHNIKVELSLCEKPKVDLIHICDEHVRVMPVPTDNEGS